MTLAESAYQTYASTLPRGYKWPAFQDLSPNIQAVWEAVARTIEVLVEQRLELYSICSIDREPELIYGPPNSDVEALIAEFKAIDIPKYKNVNRFVDFLEDTHGWKRAQTTDCSF